MKQSISPKAAIGIIVVVVLVAALGYWKFFVSGPSDSHTGTPPPGMPGAPAAAPGQMPPDMAKYQMHGPAGPPSNAQGAPAQGAPAPGQ